MWFDTKKFNKCWGRDVKIFLSIKATISCFQKTLKLNLILVLNMIKRSNMPSNKDNNIHINVSSKEKNSILVLFKVCIKIFGGKNTFLKQTCWLRLHIELLHFNFVPSHMRNLQRDLRYIRSYVNKLTYVQMDVP